LRKGLIELGIKGIKSDITEHELDAMTCALVGKMKMEGKTISLGDPSEGQIIMPKGIE
jgi:predicted RNase H-like nuclease